MFRGAVLSRPRRAHLAQPVGAALWQPASLQRSRNQLPKPAAVNGLPYSVTRKPNFKSVDPVEQVVKALRQHTLANAALLPVAYHATHYFGSEPKRMDLAFQLGADSPPITRFELGHRYSPLADHAALSRSTRRSAAAIIPGNCRTGPQFGLSKSDRTVRSRLLSLCGGSGPLSLCQRNGNGQPPFCRLVQRSWQHGISAPKWPSRAAVQRPSCPDCAIGRQTADDSKGSVCRSRPGLIPRDGIAPKSCNSKTGVPPSTKDIC
jgi:hypothetical protein